MLIVARVELLASFPGLIPKPPIIAVQYFLQSKQLVFISWVIRQALESRKGSGLSMN
jgi:hypothetical protein